jgi:hypothetical protein
VLVELLPLWRWTIDVLSTIALVVVVKLPFALALALTSRRWRALRQLNMEGLT